MGKVCSLRICSLLAATAMLLGNQPMAKSQPGSEAWEILLSHGFLPNPTQSSGLSGGPFLAKRVIARELTPTGLCLGYINAQPNHILTLETFFDYLSVKVDSEQDTTLIVQGPGGIWCSDDVQGHNPEISGQWQAGSYQIWVGSYHQEEPASYILLIEEAAATLNPN